MVLRRVMRVRHRSGSSSVFRDPLVRACWTLCKFPFVLEQVLEEVVAPLSWSRSPSDFEAAADRISGFAGFEFALPPQPLLLDGGGFWLRTHIVRWASSVGF